MPDSVAVDGASAFGDVGGYARCGCCGGFHAVFEGGGTSPYAALNADDRGGVGPNGKDSLTTAEAGAQLGRANLSWGTALGQPATVSFAFRSTAPSTLPPDTQGFERFNETQIAVTLQALTAWSEVANIFFSRVNDGDGYSNSATMVFSNYTSGQSGSAAFAYLPGNASTTSNSGDVWINSSIGYNATPVLLGYGFQVLTHEIGHAIGLSHPAAYNADEGVTITYTADATYYEDSRQYTVMSYFNESNTGGNFNATSGARQYSAAPLLDDIAAAQRLYGANMTTRTGDTVYGFNSNTDRSWLTATSATADVIFAVWDAGGTDTLDFSGFADNAVIDLRQGAFSDVGGLTGNVAIAVGALIENAVGGSGADRLIGNGANNRLTGGAGADTIDGGLGNDTAVYSGQRSAYTITVSGSTTTITGPDGTDVLTNVESFQFADQLVAAAPPSGGLTLSGDVTDNVMEGTAFADNLSGLGGNDTLNGQAGDDSLNGGTGNDSVSAGDGADTVIGGAGNDTLNGGAGLDVAVFQGANGAGVSVSLSAGTAFGGDGTDSLSGFEGVVGTAFSDSIDGDGGANLIEGGGGTDVLRGFGGNDRISATGAPGQSGGAPDIVKGAATVNGSIATAVNIDSGFDLLARTDVTSATTTPHATVLGRTHGGVEYYAFTVGAGATVTFDIDGAAFDSTLRVFNGGGTELASNDDNNGDNGGERTDSFLTYTFQTAGTYYVQVAEWSTGSGTAFTSKAPATGLAYTLHVSVPGHAVVPATLTGSRLEGWEGNDTLTGGDGADRLVGGAGSDVMVGGAGADVAGYDKGLGLYYFEAVAGGGWRIHDGLSDVDTLTSIELGQFGFSQPIEALGLQATKSFDSYGYMLGYADLRAAFINNPLGAYQHFIQYGQNEGRVSDSFDGLAYIASHRDLIGAFGIDGRLGSQHFAQYGQTEGRQTTFSGANYLAAHADLRAAFGTDVEAAARHYIQYGLAEGRSTGLSVGQLPPGFDAKQYAATHIDLARVIGLDTAKATEHYTKYGAFEGRATSGFDSVAYLLSNPDLSGQTLGQVLDHWLQYGADEGRLGDTLFGREQGASHGLVNSGAFQAIDSVGDRDWFGVTLTAGQTVTFDLVGVGGGITTGGLGNGTLFIYNSAGRLVASDADSGPGADARITLTPTSSGLYYLVATGEAGSTGAYFLTATGSVSALADPTPKTEEPPTSPAFSVEIGLETTASAGLVVGDPEDAALAVAGLAMATWDAAPTGLDRPGEHFGDPTDDAWARPDRLLLDLADSLVA